MTDRAERSADAWAATGDDDLDRIRRQVAETPTAAETLWDRIDALWGWMVLLQRLGADLSDVLPLLDRIEAAPPNACRAIDEAFAVFGRLQAELDPTPSVEAPLAPVADPGGPPAETRAAWPGYARDLHHTAAADEPGPAGGRVAWRFATGLAWGARPAVEGGRVYVASPGIRTLFWCLDLETGKVLWKTRRHRQRRAGRHSHALPQSYTTPAAASTPHLLADEVVVAEMGAQGRDEGRRRVLWLDRETGSLRRTETVGWADYRVGSARLAGCGPYIVHTDGVQRIQPNPPQAIGHNRVLCRRAADGALLWDFPVGPTFATPAMDDERAYVGTRDGVLFALHLAGASEEAHFGYSDTARVAWQHYAGAAMNRAPCVTDDAVLVGANDGTVACLEKRTGKQRWRTDTGDREPRAFQLFSTPTVAAGRVFVGTAARTLACLDATTGEVCWRRATPDWVRARPVVTDEGVMAATLDGRITCFDARDPEAPPRWQVRPGPFGYFGDPVLAGGRLLLTDARLNLVCLDAATGDVRWRRSLLQHADVGGRLVQADELACGGFHQSKPTAVGGTVFVGAPCRFVFALDARTGAERWRFELGAAVSCAPAWAPEPGGAGTVFAGQQGGENDFYALDAATGLPRWTQALGWVWSSATAADGRVYIPGTDGYLNCLDAATGHILWRYRTGRAAHPEAPLDAGRVFFGSWDHFVYAFDAADGRLLWKFHTGGQPDSGAPIAHGGRLYVPMGGKRLACLDAATGTLLWETRTEGGCMNASPALWRGRLLVSTSVRSGAIPPASELRCLDAADGTEHWRAPGGGITGPCAAADKVYTASTSDCWFRCLDGETGREVWRVALGDRVYESVPAIHMGRAFFLAEDGFLYAIA